MNTSFFVLKSGVSAEDLSALLSSDNANIQCLRGADHIITNVVGSAECGIGSLCYVATPEAAAETEGDAGAIVITKPDLVDAIPAGHAVIVSDHPRVAFSSACTRLCLPRVFDVPAEIDPTAQIAPSAVVGNGVVIGAHTIVGAGAVIGDGVTIGAHCTIHPYAILSHAVIGDRVTLMGFSAVGDAGFGFDMTPEGPVMAPHLGGVSVGDGSFIGANSVIHRGGLRDTVIGASVMLDSLCHIAHNCVLGDRVVAAAQLGVAGSTVIGSDVMIGGQVGIADHITIGDGAVLTARSGITKDIPAGMTVAGFPAQDAGVFWREKAAMRGMLRRDKNKE